MAEITGRKRGNMKNLSVKMHKEYGVVYGKKCKDCCNLTVKSYANKYFKCTAYGISDWQNTDWRKKYDACGLYNKDFSTLGLHPLVRSREPKEDFVPDGQIKLFEQENT